MTSGEETFFFSKDGLRLFLRKWEPPSPRGFCILLHGLGEHSGRYGVLAHELTKEKLSVWAFDHRGHGRSQGRRGDCRSFDDFLGDVDQALLQAREAFPGLPAVLIGHSLGGLIALHVAAKNPLGLKAVAVSSPALALAQEPPRLKVAVAETFSRILPTTPLPNGVRPEFLSRDPQVVSAYEKDPLIHRVVTARCAVILRAAMKKGRALARRIKIPCLILQAGSDKICDRKAAETFAGQSDPSFVSFRCYEGLYHEVFNERERGQVITDLLSWMRNLN